MENIAPQLLQAAGHQDDVLVERHSRALRDTPNHHSRLHEEGLLERLSPKITNNSLSFNGLWRQDLLERLGCISGLRGLSSPIPRMVLAPLPHPFSMFSATEVLAVCGFFSPTALAGRCAGLSTWRVGTGALMPQGTGVWMEEGLTGLTGALSVMAYHWPVSPEAND